MYGMNNSRCLKLMQSMVDIGVSKASGTIHQFSPLPMSYHPRVFPELRPRVGYSTKQPGWTLGITSKVGDQPVMGRKQYNNTGQIHSFRFRSLTFRGMGINRTALWYHFHLVETLGPSKAERSRAEDIYSCPASVLQPVCGRTVHGQPTWFTLKSHVGFSS